MASRSKVLSKNKQCSRLPIEGVRLKSARDVLSGISRAGDQAEFICRAYADRRRFCYFCDKAASKIPGNSTYCALLYFLRRSLRLGFYLSAFPRRKSLRICSFCAPYCAFAGHENMRCAQIEPKFNFTTHAQRILPE